MVNLDAALGIAIVLIGSLAMTSFVLFLANREADQRARLSAERSGL